MYNSIKAAGSVFAGIPTAHITIDTLQRAARRPSFSGGVRYRSRYRTERLQIAEPVVTARLAGTRGNAKQINKVAHNHALKVNLKLGGLNKDVFVGRGTDMFDNEWSPPGTVVVAVHVGHIDGSGVVRGGCGQRGAGDGLRLLAIGGGNDGAVGAALFVVMVTLLGWWKLVII